MGAEVYRIGQIKISREILFSEDFKWALHMLFGVFTPYKIEQGHYPHVLCYTGFCDKFSEVTEGNVIPEYFVEFNEKEKTMLIRGIVP